MSSFLDFNVAEYFPQRDFVVSLVKEIATSMRNNARFHTAHQKTRAEVRGGGKKPWKQKGTGNARAGSSRSPIWKGGGVTFAKRSVLRQMKINKRKYKLAFEQVLHLYATEGCLVSFNATSLIDINKTKQSAMLFHDARELLLHANAEVKINKSLIILSKDDAHLKLAFSNLPTVSVRSRDQVNLLDLIESDLVMTTPTTLESLRYV